MLRAHLEQVDAADKTIASIDAEVERLLEPFRGQVQLLKTIPGVSDLVARTILAEIGADMTPFATAAHLISWAGFARSSRKARASARAPGYERAHRGSSLSLVQAGWAASRKKDSYFRARFARLKTRRGPKKAVVAVAASMLTATYFMLRDGTAFQDLGANYFDKVDRAPRDQEPRPSPREARVPCRDQGDRSVNPSTFVSRPADVSP